MSEKVLVSFGLSPYDHARRLGFTDCSAITSMQIEGSDVLALTEDGGDHRNPATSYLDIEVPRDIAESTHSFLRIQDAVRRASGPKIAHTNCHVAAGTARGWISPYSVQPALMQGYKLNPDEVERIRPKNFGDLKPGEVYSFTGERGAKYGWLHPVHSFMQLPGTDLHFSQLGWNGNPYIGDLRGSMEYFDGKEKGMYHVVAKPRDIDSIDDWYQRVLACRAVQATPAELDKALAEFRQVEQVIRDLGHIPVQRAAALV